MYSVKAHITVTFSSVLRRARVNHAEMAELSKVHMHHALDKGTHHCVSLSVLREAIGAAVTNHEIRSQVYSALNQVPANFLVDVAQ